MWMFEISPEGFAIFSSNIKRGTEKRSGQRLTQQILDISLRKLKKNNQ